MGEKNEWGILNFSVKFDDKNRYRKRGSLLDNDENISIKMVLNVLIREKNLV